MRTVIVGGGIMGVAIAEHVARGRDPLEEPVVLFEKRELAAGSSGRSGAIVRQFYADAELVTMARDSLRAYATFEARTGRSVGFQRCGVLTIAGPANPESLAIVARTVPLMRSLGVAAEIVDAAAMRAIVPGIDVDERALGCFEPEAGAVEPVRAVEAFAARARESGVSTRLCTRVRRLLVRGSRVVGVETDDGELEAHTTIVAAGPWSRALLAEIGVDLPLTVLRPEQHFVAMPDIGARDEARGETLDDLVLDRFGLRTPVQRPAAHPVVLDLEHGFYTRCEGFADRTRVGKLDYHGDDVVPDPDELDESVRASFRAWARSQLERRLPLYEREPDVGAQPGMYTVTPDAQAILGRIDGLEGLVVATGFSGHGFKLAPSIGAGIAQIVAGDPVTAFDAQFFSASRFARAEPGRKTRAFGL